MATAVDCALSLDLICAIEVVRLLLTARRCADESEIVFRARRTCLPGGVQGDGFHLNKYVNSFNDTLREFPV